MQRRAALVAVAGLAFVVSHALAKPNQPHELSEYEVDVDVVGDVDGTNPAPQKVLQDTIWIADWSFDTGAPCSEAEWVHVDNRILNDGTSYWHAQVAADFPAQTSGMAGNVYALGYHDNACCEGASGYASDWYQAYRAPSGVYVLRLVHGAEVESAKFVMMR